MTRRAALAALLAAAALLLTGYSLGRSASRPGPMAIPASSFRPVTVSRASLRAGESDPSDRTGAPLHPTPVSTQSAGPVASPEPATSPAGSGHLARASWYCSATSRCTVGYPASCLCAAASPDLHLRGQTITVTYGSRSVRVAIIDCLCSRKGGLDLYAQVWRMLGVPLSVGVIWVRWSA